MKTEKVAGTNNLSLSTKILFLLLAITLVGVIVITVIKDKERLQLQTVCTYTNITGATTTLSHIDELYDKTRYRFDGCKENYY